MAVVSTRNQQYADCRLRLLQSHLHFIRKFDLVLFLLAGMLMASSMWMSWMGLDFSALAARSLLVVTWGLMSAVVAISLLSFLLAQAGTYSLVRSAKALYTQDRETASRIELLSKFCDLLNWLSAFTFVGSIVCLTVFVAINIYSE